MKQNPEDKIQSLYDLATHKGSTQERGLNLEEALAQVDELDKGDEELKAIYRSMYTLQVPRKPSKP